MRNFKSIQEAKAFLKENGYCTDNLWTVSDVQSKFRCTDEQAQEVISGALENSATMEQIWFAIGFHGEEMGLEKLEDWKCTDLDNDQWGRQLGESLFEFKEKNRGLDEYEEDEFIEIRIDLDDYHQSEMENHISAYYEDIAEVISIYGKQANWIIAECIFEQESGLY